ncbi:hypothetical protein PQQ59_33450 [Paraburkholderia aspalathi]|uniref:hypothetical protein n=1 Tax=Paraburkholderia aspalathi TaxID=1324617 RepID=UPI0038B79758
MKSRKPIEIAASKYGRNYAIATFIAWVIVQELLMAHFYGWHTKATPRDLLASGTLLLIGAFVAMYVGKLADARYKRNKGAEAAH